MVLESQFQTDVIEQLRVLFPGCIILKNDPNYLQGFPDLLILYRYKWAALEVKASEKSRTRPNQEYYIGLCSEMSYASFVYPENLDRVLDELQQTFNARGHARIFRRF